MYTLLLLRERFLSHLECFFHSPLSPQSYDIEGVLGLSWAFGIPTFDIIHGTAIDYMHCVCEGVVEQLLNSWFSQDNKDKLYFIGNRVEEVDKEFLSIKPISEVTRTPRSIMDKKDWKG